MKERERRDRETEEGTKRVRDSAQEIVFYREKDDTDNESERGVIEMEAQNICQISEISRKEKG